MQYLTPQSDSIEGLARYAGLLPAPTELLQRAMTFGKDLSWKKAYIVKMSVHMLLALFPSFKWGLLETFNPLIA